MCICTYLIHFESVKKEEGKVLLCEDCDNLRSNKCTDDLQSVCIWGGGGGGGKRESYAEWNNIICNFRYNLYSYKHLHGEWKVKQPSYQKIKLKDNYSIYQIKIRFY